MDDKDKQFGKADRLEWRDYLAMIVAMLETTLLPIVIVAVVLVLLVLVIRR